MALSPLPVLPPLPPLPLEPFALDYIGDPATQSTLCAHGPLTKDTIGGYLARARKDLEHHDVVSQQLVHALLPNLSDDDVYGFFGVYTNHYSLIPHSLPHLLSAVLDAWPRTFDYFFTTQLPWPFTDEETRAGLTQLASGTVDQSCIHYLVLLLTASGLEAIPENVVDYLRASMVHYAAVQTAELEFSDLDLLMSDEDLLTLVQEDSKPIYSHTETISDLFMVIKGINPGMGMEDFVAIADVVRLLPLAPHDGYDILARYPDELIMTHAAAIVASVAAFETVEFDPTYGSSSMYTVMSVICAHVQRPPGARALPSERHRRAETLVEVRGALELYNIVHVFTAAEGIDRISPPYTHAHLHCVCEVLDAKNKLDPVKHPKHDPSPGGLLRVSPKTKELVDYINRGLRIATLGTGAHAVHDTAIHELVHLAYVHVPHDAIDLVCLIRLIAIPGCHTAIISTLLGFVTRATDRDCLQLFSRDLGPHVWSIMTELRHYVHTYGGPTHGMRVLVRAFSDAYPFEIADSIDRAEDCPFIILLSPDTLWMLEWKCTSLAVRRIDTRPAMKLLWDDPVRAVEAGLVTGPLFQSDDGPMPPSFQPPVTLAALMPSSPHVRMTVVCRHTFIYHLATEKTILPEHMSMLRVCDQKWAGIMRRVTERVPDLAEPLALARAWNRRRGWCMVVHCLSAEKGTKHACILRGRGRCMEHVYRSAAGCEGNRQIATTIASFL